MASTAGALGRLTQRILRCSRIVAGQPTPETHPELLKEGQIWPGVHASEFAVRRRHLAEALPPGGIAVVPSAAKVFMTGQVPYTYRQDSDFLYLTGISQQGVAVIEAASPLRAAAYTLFVPDNDAHDTTWNGERLNTEAAIEVFGADEALPLSEMEHVLESMIATSGAVFCDRGEERSTHPCEPMKLHSAMLVALQQRRVQALRPLLHPMRWRKSAAEMELMRSSAALAAAALTRCMQLSRPGIAEHELAATFEYECKVRGAQRLAYPIVVAGGADSCTIHYLKNNKKVRAGELVLMDAGCELHGYSSDVTRTWPVSGTFNKHQRTVYEIVLDTHRQCMEMCRVGRTLREVHQLSVSLLSEGVASLGIFPGMNGAAISHSTYRMVYPHSVGHWLGMDTHDTRCVTHDKELEEGAVLTIEPGLYIPNEPQLYGPYAGIGVRIEDDVAVTGSRPEVLSAGVPVDPQEIERLVKGS